MTAQPEEITEMTEKDYTEWEVFLQQWNRFFAALEPILPMLEQMNAGGMPPMPMMPGLAIPKGMPLPPGFPLRG